MLDLEREARLQDLRQRVHSGQHLTAAEYRQIVDDIRQHREATAAPSRKAAKQRQPKNEPPLDLADLFNNSNT